jgi:hypothetical protein
VRHGGAVFSPGIIMTEDTTDPLLSTAETAALLGCDERGVNVLMRCGKLRPEPERWGKRLKLRFRRSAVEAVRSFYHRLRDLQLQGYHDHPERGREYTLLKAAEARGLPLHLLRKEVKGPSLFPDLFNSGKLPAEDIEPPPTGAKAWKVVREVDLLALEARLKQSIREGERLNRGRWKLMSEICEALGIDDPAGKTEVSDCLGCWSDLGWISRWTALVCQVGRVPGTWEVSADRRVFKDLRSVERFRRLTFYNFAQFERLRNDKDYLTKGARRLNQLVAEHGGRCPARVVAAELKKIGVAGKVRLSRAAKAARVRPVHDWGPGAKNQLIYIPEGKRRPQNPVEVMRAVLAEGPVPAGDGLRAGRARGLTTVEVYAAIKTLNVQLKEKARVGGHSWELPPSSSPRRRKRGAGKETAARHARIIREMATGNYDSQSDLARHLGIDPATVSRVLRNANVAK